MCEISRSDVVVCKKNGDLARCRCVKYTTTTTKKEPVVTNFLQINFSSSCSTFNLFSSFYIYYDYLLIVYVVVCVFGCVADVEHSIRRFIDVIECNGVRAYD